jgi:hypothetical protein
MAYLMLRYNLKEGVKEEQFETWVRTVDQPKMRSLQRVKSFETFKVSGLLMGEGKSHQQYFEIFEIDDISGFTGEDMGGELVQSVMGEFMQMVDNPEFNLAEKI